MRDSGNGLGLPPIPVVAPVLCHLCGKPLNRLNSDCEGGQHYAQLMVYGGRWTFCPRHMRHLSYAETAFGKAGVCSWCRPDLLAYPLSRKQGASPKGKEGDDPGRKGMEIYEGMF
jgi:hypothetical protein